MLYPSAAVVAILRASTALPYFLTSYVCPTTLYTFKSELKTLLLAAITYHLLFDMTSISLRLSFGLYLMGFLSLFPCR